MKKCDSETVKICFRNCFFLFSFFSPQLDIETSEF